MIKKHIIIGFMACIGLNLAGVSYEAAKNPEWILNKVGLQTYASAPKENAVCAKRIWLKGEYHNDKFDRTFENYGIEKAEMGSLRLINEFYNAKESLGEILPVADYTSVYGLEEEQIKNLASIFAAIQTLYLCTEGNSWIQNYSYFNYLDAAPQVFFLDIIKHCLFFLFAALNDTYAPIMAEALQNPLLVGTQWSSLNIEDFSTIDDSWTFDYIEAHLPAAQYPFSLLIVAFSQALLNNANSVPFLSAMLTDDMKDWIRLYIEHSQEGSSTQALDERQQQKGSLLSLLNEPREAKMAENIAKLYTQYAADDHCLPILAIMGQDHVVAVKDRLGQQGFDVIVINSLAPAEDIAVFVDPS